MMYGKPPMQTKPGPMPAQRPPYGMQPPGQYQPGPMPRPVNALGMGMQPRPQMYNALAMYGRR